MRLKLSKAEMQSLQEVLFIISKRNIPDSVFYRLLQAIIIKFYQKVAKELVVIKSRYSIKMDEGACLAFALSFDQLIDLDVTLHAGNLVLQICNKIKQQYP